MLGLTLPDWFTPENARTIALVVMVVAALLVLVVIRFVQKMVMKLACAIVLVVIGFIAWHERTDLADCARTCECRLLVFDVKIPTDQLPADQDVVCGDRG